jgi:hypothetical protein
MVLLVRVLLFDLIIKGKTNIALRALSIQEFLKQVFVFRLKLILSRGDFMRFLLPLSFEEIDVLSQLGGLLVLILALHLTGVRL